MVSLYVCISVCVYRVSVCPLTYYNEYTLECTKSTHISIPMYTRRTISHCLYTHTHTHIYIYEGHTISFQTFFVWAFKIDVDSWKFSILLLYILWDDWPAEQLQQQLEYTLLKPDCHSWWISKMQSDTLEEQYAIKFCFKQWKNATETYGMLQTAFGASCMNRTSVFEWYKRFKEGRESVRDDERCGRSKEVNTLELIGQTVRVRVTMLRF